MRSSLRPKHLAGTYFDAGVDRLRSLCRASGLEARSEGAVDLFARMIDPWGSTMVPTRPLWRSEVGDDHTPFEFSITIGRTNEVRVLVEPLGANPSLVTNRDASLKLLTTLEKDFQIDLSRFRRIEDLFLPRDPRGPFSIWIAAQLGAGKDPDFKLYLNPMARGKHLAPAVVEEALVRLGFGAAWPTIGRTLVRRGPEFDELNYFSIDLSPSPEARVKVYARHREPTVADLEATAQAALSYRRGDLTRFLETLVPAMGPTFQGRPPQSCYTFVDSKTDRPAAATLHFPINGYARNDEIVHERVLACLEQFDLETTTYSSCIKSFSGRPLDRGIGLQSYVSFRRYKSEARITVYFPLEIYRPGTVAKPPSTVPPSDTVEIANRVEASERITDHPFLRRLRREPASRPHLLLLARNLKPLTERQVEEQFARVSARIDDERTRAAFDALLNVSGPGAFPDAPPQTIPLTIVELDPAPANSERDHRPATGNALQSAIQESCDAADVYEAAGAVLATKTFGKQLDGFLLEQLRRAPGIDAARLDSMPPDRDDLQLGFAELGAGTDIPQDAVDALWRGACVAREAAWEFLNALYERCYGLTAKDGS